MATPSPFRFFARGVVEECIQKTRVPSAELTGTNRRDYRGNVLIFDTFDTLSDPVEYFAEAMNTELEHGTAGDVDGTNVTDDDALNTARIAAAHVKGIERWGRRPYRSFPDYYDFLWWMERLHERALERR